MTLIVKLRRSMRALFISFCFVLVPAFVAMGGSQITIKGVTWQYMVTDEGVVIGTGSPDPRAIPYDYRGGVTIPNEINGIKVVGISDYAFFWCQNLTSIKIPSSVRTIGVSAFESCSGLSTINLPSDLAVIGDRAFSGCSNLSAIQIPAGVEAIGDEAVLCCAALEEISVDESNALYASVDGVLYDKSKRNLICCPMHKSGSMTIPETVTNVCEKACYNCECLTSLTIPGNVIRVGKYAFSSCRGLLDISLGSGIGYIDDNAFEMCSGIQEIVIPGSVQSIGAESFRSCSWLAKVTLGEGTSRIGDNAFYACNNLSEFNIPQSVKEIEAGAFGALHEFPDGAVIVDGCVLGVNGKVSGVMRLPSGTRMVVPYAFYYQDIEGIVLPEGVEKVDEYAFMCCEKLKVVQVASSVTNIKANAFYQCPNIEEAEIPIFQEHISTIFPDSYNRITSLKICSEGVYLTDSAFSECNGLVSVDLSGTPIATIGNHTFAGCERLLSIEMPSTVKVVGESAFRHCYGLTNVVFSEGLQSIGDHAFEECSSLERVEVPCGVKCIGSRVFYGCNGLTVVTLRDGVECIGPESFRECGRLAIVGLPRSVKDIGERAFYSCSCLKSIDLVEGITNIGTAAFCYCTQLKSVTIPSTVESMGDYVFQSSGVESAVVSEGVRGLPNQAFYSCSWLAMVTIPPSVQTIGALAFYGCNKYFTVVVMCGDKARVSQMLPAAGLDGAGISWVEKDFHRGVIDDLAQLQEAFGPESEVARNVTSDAELSSFNSFLSSCGVSQASSLSEAQKKWAYRSFKLSSIAALPMMFEAEPELKIDTFSPAGSDWSICISLSAGGLAVVEMAKDKLKERIRVGTSVEDICIQPNILAMPSADGTQLQFTIELPRGLQGFATVRID